MMNIAPKYEKVSGDGFRLIHCVAPVIERLRIVG